MSHEPSSIEDSDLQAYVDQRLDPARHARVEAYLREHPEAAERVREFRQQNEMLHGAFDAVLEEPVPQRLQNTPRHSARRWSYAAIAASLFIGVTAGWLARGPASQPSTYAYQFPHQAAIAHVVYTPEILHPVEVGADQEEHLVKWLSKRLGVTVQAPHLQNAGYALEGGRLLPGNDGPAAQFMYRDASGQRLTLYVRTDVKDNTESAFRFANENGVSVFYWIDRNIAYALSGEVDRERLLAVAQNIYQELNR